MLRSLAGHVESSIERIAGAPETNEDEEEDELDDAVVVVGEEDDEEVETEETEEAAEVVATAEELLDAAEVEADFELEVVTTEDVVEEVLLTVARKIPAPRIITTITTRTMIMLRAIPF